jgi:hypothetical protein
MISKDAGALTVADFVDYPVWEFNGEEIGAEYALQPVMDYPVTHMNDRVVGVLVVLANGQKFLCVISSLGDIARKDVLEHAIFSFLAGGQRIPVYPYSHPLSKTFGPSALAEKLNLPTDEIFPFAYDLRGALGLDYPFLTGQWYADASFGEEELWERAMALVEKNLGKER